MISYLTSRIVNRSLSKGSIICEKEKPLYHLPAIYLVRSGTVEIKKSESAEIERIQADGYFGDDQMYADTRNSDYVSPYTATVTEDCVVGVLLLNVCRRVLNTHRIDSSSVIKEFDSFVIEGAEEVSLDMLDLCRIIGSGTFGQVWSVTRPRTDGKLKQYALKIQSKYQLCKSGQALVVVREKNIMAQFHNPFVARLVASFQDDKFVYMVMDLLQGGELYNVIHTPYSNKLDERSAKFYFACIAEGISYLHRMLFVYRDLKPEVRGQCSFFLTSLERNPRQQRIRKNHRFWLLQEGYISDIYHVR